MNELQKVFDYSGVQIRTIVKNDEVWFVARDICEILEHSQVSKAVERLDDDEKLLGTIFLSGQNRETWLINESGLYSLILSSRKPEANLSGSESSY
jgi:anti-repressor protein